MTDKERKMVMSESWEELTSKVRSDFLYWFHELACARMEAGRQRYNRDNEKFQGDPFTHGIEEAIDNLFYWFYAQRKYQALEHEYDELDHEYDELDKEIKEVNGR